MMNFFNYRIVALLGLGLFSAGCSADPVEDETLDAPVLRPLDGNTGTHGNNGLTPFEYQLNRSELDALLQKPLTVKGEMNPDHDFVDFVSSPAGKKVLTYAIECALPADTAVGDFKGAGLMTTTGAWLKEPLDLQQRRDVHTCVTTRLNPLGVHVGIWLGGPDTGKDTRASDYGYSEALWSVDVNVDGGFTFSVWPLDTFTDLTACENTTVGAVPDDFNTRLCENNPALCIITLRHDRDTACKGEPGLGNWICDGKPAIETRLGDETAWDTMHPTCPILHP